MGTVYQDLGLRIWTHIGLNQEPSPQPFPRRLLRHLELCRDPGTLSLLQVVS